MTRMQPGGRSYSWDDYPSPQWRDGFTWGAGTVGAEPLNPRPGRRMLELGCGAGANAAHLAALGVHVTAIDCSPVQVAKARNWWGHLPNLAVQHADALAYLTLSGTAVWDAVYSVFGAAWFSDPDRLLPAVRSALRSGGLFAFSHADAQPEGVGPLTSCPEKIVRWDYRPHTWVATLQRYGFQDVVTRELPATRGFPHWPTMLVTACA